MDNAKKGIPVDLHIHTICSDGSHTADECVMMARDKGLSVIAITDHDTVEGIEDAIFAGEEYGIGILPGVEISAADYSHHFHFLCYFKDDIYIKIQHWFYDLRNTDRRNTMDKVFELMTEQGYSIDRKELINNAKRRGYGAYRVFELMKDAGYFESAQAVERQFFTKGKPYYSEDLFTLINIFEFLKEKGCLIFWAHPFEYGIPEKYMEPILKDLIDIGIDGIETERSTASSENARFLKELCRKYNLLETAGSDFHGILKPGIEIGDGCEKKPIPYSIYENIVSAWSDK